MGFNLLESKNKRQGDNLYHYLFEAQLTYERSPLRGPETYLRLYKVHSGREKRRSNPTDQHISEGGVTTEGGLC